MINRAFLMKILRYISRYIEEKATYYHEVKAIDNYSLYYFRFFCDDEGVTIEKIKDFFKLLEQDCTMSEYKILEVSVMQLDESQAWHISVIYELDELKHLSWYSHEIFDMNIIHDMIERDVRSH
jgi:hypothetical protein